MKKKKSKIRTISLEHLSQSSEKHQRQDVPKVVPTDPKKCSNPILVSEDARTIYDCNIEEDEGSYKESTQSEPKLLKKKERTLYSENTPIDHAFYLEKYSKVHRKELHGIKATIQAIIRVKFIESRTDILTVIGIDSSSSNMKKVTMRKD